MTYKVYAVVFGDQDPPEVWSLYAEREQAEKDVQRSEGNPLRIEPMPVWETADLTSEERS